MKFQFKLQKVLHFIRLKEEMKKMEVSTSMTKLGFLQKRRKRIEDELTLALNKGQEDVLLWAHFQQEKVKADLFQMKQLDRLIVDQTAECDKCRGELSRISMRRRSVEALRDKRESEFRIERARKEQKQLDETHQLLSMHSKEAA